MSELPSFSSEKNRSPVWTKMYFLRVPSRHLVNISFSCDGFFLWSPNQQLSLNHLKELLEPGRGVGVLLSLVSSWYHLDCGIAWCRRQRCLRSDTQWVIFRSHTVVSTDFLWWATWRQKTGCSRTFMKWAHVGYSQWSKIKPPKKLRTRLNWQADITSHL